VFKNSESFSILIANKIFHVTLLLFIYFGDQFVASEIRHCRRVTAVFVNNQHDIKRRGQDFDKKFVFERIHSKELDRKFPGKSWTKRMLISC